MQSITLIAQRFTPESCRETCDLSSYNHFDGIGFLASSLPCVSGCALTASACGGPGHPRKTQAELPVPVSQQPADGGRVAVLSGDDRRECRARDLKDQPAAFF